MGYSAVDAQDRGVARLDRQWPAFDGMRALAVLAVMTYHLGDHRLMPGGYLGVDVFFVLSGFLITWILISEHDRSGRISYRNFYIRRALRLFPALAVLIAVCVTLVLTDGGLASYRLQTLTAVPFVVLYTGNWVTAFTNEVTTGVTLGLLGITWTLAIEEQFYLFWPLALTALLKRFTRQRIAQFLVGAAVLEMAVRAALNGSGILWFRANAATLTHSDGLLLGSALALLWTFHEKWNLWPTVKRLSPILGWASAVTLMTISIVGNSAESSVWITVAVFASLAMLIDLLARPTSPLSKLLQVRPLQWIGKRSYACYLWHTTIFALVATHSRSGLITIGMDYAGTFAVAALSYRLVERRFLVRKRKFESMIPEPSTTVVTTSVSPHAPESGYKPTPSLS